MSSHFKNLKKSRSKNRIFFRFSTASAAQKGRRVISVTPVNYFWIIHHTLTLHFGTCEPKICFSENFWRKFLTWIWVSKWQFCSCFWRVLENAKKACEKHSSTLVKVFLFEIRKKISFKHSQNAAQLRLTSVCCIWDISFCFLLQLASKLRRYRMFYIN